MLGLAKSELLCSAVEVEKRIFMSCTSEGQYADHTKKLLKGFKEILRLHNDGQCPKSIRVIVYRSICTSNQDMEVQKWAQDLVCEENAKSCPPGTHFSVSKNTTTPDDPTVKGHCASRPPQHGTLTYPGQHAGRSITRGTERVPTVAAKVAMPFLPTVEGPPRELQDVRCPLSTNTGSGTKRLARKVRQAPGTLRPLGIALVSCRHGTGRPCHNVAEQRLNCLAVGDQAPRAKRLKPATEIDETLLGVLAKSSVAGSQNITGERSEPSHHPHLVFHKSSHPLIANGPVVAPSDLETLLNPDKNQFVDRTVTDKLVFLRYKYYSFVKLRFPIAMKNLENVIRNDRPLHHQNYSESLELMKEVLRVMDLDDGRRIPRHMTHDYMARIEAYVKGVLRGCAIAREASTAQIQ